MRFAATIRSIRTLCCLGSPPPLSLLFEDLLSLQAAAPHPARASPHARMHARTCALPLTCLGTPTLPHPRHTHPRHTHPHARTHPHACAQTLSHTRTHKHAPKHPRAQPRTRAHTCADAHMPIHARARPLRVRCNVACCINADGLQPRAVIGGVTHPHVHDAQRCGPVPCRASLATRRICCSVRCCALHWRLSQAWT